MFSEKQTRLPTFWLVRAMSFILVPTSSYFQIVILAIP
ncbi:hypothetical protein LINPERHAP2_LOCUS13512 [Linum perenne]